MHSDLERLVSEEETARAGVEAARSRAHELFGSTTKKVVRRAICPVLTLRR